jgi:transposase-like protein
MRYYERPKGFLRLHSDEKFIKIRGIGKAYWWSTIDHFGNYLSSCITINRDLASAKDLIRPIKWLKPDIHVTDGLFSYIKATHLFGRKCKHIIAGIKGKWVMHNNSLYWITNNPVESLNAKINNFLHRFRGCFVNIESANRWRKAFIFGEYLLKSFEQQRKKGVHSKVVSPQKMFLRN